MNGRKLGWLGLGFAAVLAAGLFQEARAATLGVQIEVFKNGVSQGTALGGADTTTNTPLIVTASNGDTLRFVVQIQGTQTQVTSSFTSTITVDGNNASGGANELTFVAGSGAMLNGAAGFAVTANPNNTLNDGSPTTGTSNESGAASGLSLNVYEVSYVVASVNADALNDFTVVLGSYASSPVADIADATKDTASVRVDGVPEPASLLLLGSGLAGLAGFVRRRRTE